MSAELLPTPAEDLVLEHLVSAWNAFVALPIEHADHCAEFRHGIHALQAQIMSRPLQRYSNGLTQ